VSKHFKIPHEKRTTILDNLSAVIGILGGKGYSYEEFWALRNISFRLEHGESLGIIGPNGSGKSTLLKLMARVMKPNSGEITINGSTVSILELGIGFHGDLTVRENAVIYGIIMGLSSVEVRRRYDSIVEFAGLSKFQDTKLKHLSSGMQVRLAFSIAVQTDADIFLVDEALSVGDLEFQEKCLERFREFKKQRKSIVLVSHDLSLVNSFCEKTVYLLNGTVRFFGPSKDVTEHYLKDLRIKSEGCTIPESNGCLHPASGNARQKNERDRGLTIPP